MTDTVVVAASRAATVPVAAKVTVRASHARAGRMRLSGAVRPAVHGHAIAQLAHHGRWTRVARTRLATTPGSRRSRYRFSLPTQSVARPCHVVVFPRRGSGLVAGTSPRRIVGQ